MKKLFVVMSSVLLMMGVGTSRSFGQTPELQDLRFNGNGTVTDVPPSYSLSGLDSSLFDTSVNGTGLGTLTYTYNPGAGSSFFDVFFDIGVAAPFYNEYGTPNGTPASDETWEIGDSFASNIFSDFTAGGALSDVNSLGGQVDDYDGSCVGATCNGDAAVAFGETFVLTSGEDEIITITSSLTKPTSGFYIDQTHPVDAGNTSQGDVYLSISATTGQVCTANCSVPPVPEPSSWLLVASGLGLGISGLRRRVSMKAFGKAFGVAAMFAMVWAVAPMANAQKVLTVPWDPTNLTAPHTAYAGANIVLGAVFIPPAGADTYTYTWNFGDTTPVVPVNLTNPNDISARHVYSVESDGVTPATIGYNWTATVTITDTTIHSAVATGTYLVIWEDGTKLPSRVNVAIDLGLWYMHQSMYHASGTTGTWDNCASGLTNDCNYSGYGSLTATNVQAMEVSGHTATEANAAVDPYATDVAEGLASMFTHLTVVPNASQITYEGVIGASKTYNYNPATANYGCSDGSAPSYTSSPMGKCLGAATPVYYNAGATSCTSPPCTFSFDGNSNGHVIIAQQESGIPYGWGYESGMYVDALVASGSPSATATTGPVGVIGQTYLNIVQDIADAANFCQWSGNNDASTGYERGYPYGGNFGQGGGWWYDCQQGNDNSTSQWASIGLLGAKQAFGVPIPSIVTDANNMWVTDSQDVQGALPTGKNSYSVGGDYGAFGYNGSLNYSNAWGPFAVTPSGMVQMALDGIGRAKNTVFGDATTDPDQRFNHAETFYADNFCNNPVNGAVNSPRAYTYGLFSFTKSMLLHNPGGALSPIQYLRTLTPGVFTTNSTVPANTIDWYAAVGSGHAYSDPTNPDPCDGVAETIVDRQNSAGYWINDNYSGYANTYETAWSLIMLQRTVFVNCVNNLQGRGTPSTGAATARIDLTWTGQPNATGYTVYISPTTGGPYTQVPYNGGTTTTTVFSDRSGLVNNTTYYFVIQPTNGAGTVCQSNQATVKIPLGR